MMKIKWLGQVDIQRKPELEHSYDVQGFYFPLFQTDIRDSSYKKRSRYMST